MTHPYIGITGIRTATHMNAVQNAAPRTAPYKIMLGMLASQNRLAAPSIAGTQSPALHGLASLAALARPGFLPMVHYHSESEQLAAEVMTVFRTNNLLDHCSAVQLNRAWPAPAQLERMLDDLPNLKIVLQLPNRALDELSPLDVARRAQAYSGLASYILIDPSGGLGKSYDEPRALEQLAALHEALPSMRLGVAGGLGPINVFERFSALRKLPFAVSIDAQGKLRGSDGTLDTTLANAYLTNAAKAL